MWGQQWTEAGGPRRAARRPGWGSRLEGSAPRRPLSESEDQASRFSSPPGVVRCAKTGCLICAGLRSRAFWISEDPECDIEKRRGVLPQHWGSERLGNRFVCALGNRGNVDRFLHRSAVCRRCGHGNGFLTRLLRLQETVRHGNSQLLPLRSTTCLMRTRSETDETPDLRTLSLFKPRTTSDMRFSSTGSPCVLTTQPGSGGKLLAARSNLGGDGLTSMGTAGL